MNEQDTTSSATARERQYYEAGVREGERVAQARCTDYPLLDVQCRVRQLTDDACEVKVGGATLTILKCQAEEATRFVEHIQVLFGQRQATQKRSAGQ